MHSVAPSSDVSVHLSVRHYSCTRAFQQQGSFANSFEQANAVRFGSSATCFDTDFLVPRDTFDDWHNVSEVLLEECGLFGFEFADPLTRADAIDANAGIVAQQQTLLNAVLVKRRRQTDCQDQSPAAAVATRAEWDDQMWLRIHHVHEQVEDDTTVTKQASTTGADTQTTVATKRQWSKVAAVTHAKKCTEPLAAASVRLVIDIFYHSVLAVGIGKAGALGVPSPAHVFGTAVPAVVPFANAAPAPGGAKTTNAPIDFGIRLVQRGKTVPTQAVKTAPTKAEFGVAAAPAPDGFGSATPPQHKNRPAGFRY